MQQFYSSPAERSLSLDSTSFAQSNPFHLSRGKNFQSVDCVSASERLFNFDRCDPKCPPPPPGQFINPSLNHNNMNSNHNAMNSNHNNMSFKEDKCCVAGLEMLHSNTSANDFVDTFSSRYRLPAHIEDGDDNSGEASTTTASSRCHSHHNVISRYNLHFTRSVDSHMVGKSSLRHYNSHPATCQGVSKRKRPFRRRYRSHPYDSRVNMTTSLPSLLYRHRVPRNKNKSNALLSSGYRLRTGSLSDSLPAKVRDKTSCQSKQPNVGLTKDKRSLSCDNLTSSGSKEDPTKVDGVSNAIYTNASKDLDSVSRAIQDLCVSGNNCQPNSMS